MVWTIVQYLFLAVVFFGGIAYVYFNLIKKPEDTKDKNRIEKK